MSLSVSLFLDRVRCIVLTGPGMETDLLYTLREEELRSIQLQEKCVGCTGVCLRSK